VHHSLHIVFCTPETAKVVQTDRGNARAAQLSTPFVPPGQS
jgi:hypothetical protein